jgi:hypothetical protein
LLSLDLFALLNQLVDLVAEVAQARGRALAYRRSVGFIVVAAVRVAAVAMAAAHHPHHHQRAGKDE